MAGRERKRIGLREVRALQPEQEVWDAAVPGFGARRQRSDAIAYVLLYRTQEGRQRRLTIGRHGAPWTPDTARDEARRLLGEVVRGLDPAGDKRGRRGSMTVTELCDAYMAAAVSGRLLTRRKVPKKALTLEFDRGRLDRHVKPLLGRLAVVAVTARDVENAMHAIADGATAKRAKTKARGLAVVRGGKGVATRTMGTLGAVFTYAVREGVRSDNPVHGLQKFAEGKRDRLLGDDEYAGLGRVLASPKLNVWPAAVAVTRFLLLTGWRRSEAIGLKWSEVDLARRTAKLLDTKTGASMRPLAHAACEVLRGVSRDGGELVFPGTRRKSDAAGITHAGPMVGFRKLWLRIAAAAQLPPDVTLHVFRHSFASLAGDLGYSEPTIAALIGHQGRSITSRYVHAADAVLLAAADAVAGRTLELMRVTLESKHGQPTLTASSRVGA